MLFEFRHDLWHQNTKSPGGIAQYNLRDPKFSRFAKTQVWPTDRHMMPVYTALGIASHGNKKSTFTGLNIKMYC